MQSDQAGTSMSSTMAGLALQPEYRSELDDLIDEFYAPCLQRSVLYRRAVGYFTSYGLSAAARGIATLMNNRGSMRLVASPLFEPEDLDAIVAGYAARSDVVSKALLRKIDGQSDGATTDRLGYLAWMISEERLEIRIAVPVPTAGSVRCGIYHEKLGIFSDGVGNHIAFSGSANETSGGLLDSTRRQKGSRAIDSKQEPAELAGLHAN